MKSDMRCWCGGAVSRGAGLTMVCLDSVQHDPTATGERAQIKKLYVAGPMSGIADNNYPEFNRVTQVLRDVGYEVVNPAEYGDGASYVDLLREDLRAMLDCHGIATLDRWWASTGARNEILVGGLLKMPVRMYDLWLERAAFELA